MSTAAAAAALQSPPSSPVSLADVQTKRTARRRNSTSSTRSLKFLSKESKFLRRGSFGSVSQRSFRQLSQVYSGATNQTPPLPDLPCIIQQNKLQGKMGAPIIGDRVDAQKTTRRKSCLEINGSARSASIPVTTNCHKLPSSNQPNCRRSVNFSLPTDSRSTSPATQRQLTSPLSMNPANIFPLSSQTMKYDSELKRFIPDAGTPESRQQIQASRDTRKDKCPSTTELQDMKRYILAAIDLGDNIKDINFPLDSIVATHESPPSLNDNSLSKMTTCQLDNARKSSVRYQDDQSSSKNVDGSRFLEMLGTGSPKTLETNQLSIQCDAIKSSNTLSSIQDHHSFGFKYNDDRSLLSSSTSLCEAETVNPIKYTENRRSNGNFRSLSNLNIESPERCGIINSKHDIIEAVQKPLTGARSTHFAKPPENLIITHSPPKIFNSPRKYAAKILEQPSLSSGNAESPSVGAKYRPSIKMSVNRENFDIKASSNNFVKPPVFGSISKVGPSAEITSMNNIQTKIVDGPSDIYKDEAMRLGPPYLGGLQDKRRRTEAKECFQLLSAKKDESASLPLPQTSCETLNNEKLKSNRYNVPLETTQHVLKESTMKLSLLYEEKKSVNKDSLNDLSTDSSATSLTFLETPIDDDFIGSDQKMITALDNNTSCTEVFHIPGAWQFSTADSDTQLSYKPLKLAGKLEHQSRLDNTATEVILDKRAVTSQASGTNTASAVVPLVPQGEEDSESESIYCDAIEHISEEDECSIFPRFTCVNSKTNEIDIHSEHGRFPPQIPILDSEIPRSMGLDHKQGADGKEDMCMVAATDSMAQPNIISAIGYDCTQNDNTLHLNQQEITSASKPPDRPAEQQRLTYNDITLTPVGNFVKEPSVCISDGSENNTMRNSTTVLASLNLKKSEESISSFKRAQTLAKGSRYRNTMRRPKGAEAARRDITPRHLDPFITRSHSSASFSSHRSLSHGSSPITKFSARRTSKFGFSTLGRQRPSKAANKKTDDNQSRHLFSGSAEDGSYLPTFKNRSLKPSHEGNTVDSNSQVDDKLSTLKKAVNKSNHDPGNHLNDHNNMKCINDSSVIITELNQTDGSLPQSSSNLNESNLSSLRDADSKSPTIKQRGSFMSALRKKANLNGYIRKADKRDTSVFNNKNYQSSEKLNDLNILSSHENCAENTPNICLSTPKFDTTNIQNNKTKTYKNDVNYSIGEGGIGDTVKSYFNESDILSDTDGVEMHPENSGKKKIGPLRRLFRPD